MYLVLSTVIFMVPYYYYICNLQSDKIINLIEVYVGVSWIF